MDDGRLTALFQGNMLLTGSWVAHNSLQLWDVGSCSLIKNVPLHVPEGTVEYTYCCRFCDSDVILCGGSGTNSLHALNHSTNQVHSLILLFTASWSTYSENCGGCLHDLAAVKYLVFGAIIGFEYHE